MTWLWIIGGIVIGVCLFIVVLAWLMRVTDL